MKIKPRVLFTIVSILAVVILINYYIGWHVRIFIEEAVGLAKGGTIYWIVFWLVMLSYIWSRLAEKVLPGPVYRLFKVIGSCAMILMLYGLLLLPLADLSAWMAHLAGVRMHEYVTVIGYATLLVLAVIVLIGSRNAWSPVIRRYELSVAKNAGSTKRLKIAVASDLHLGVTVGNRHLQRLVELIREMKPDLILLPGDVLDDSVEPFIRRNLAEVMKQLQAPLGVFAVLGNHEYFGGHIGDYVERMRAVGIRVLQDEIVQLDNGIVIVGRKDKAAERFDPAGRKPLEELIADVDRTHPIVLLDHQPHRLDLAEAAGVDIMLSGHTHRGQMAPSHLVTRRLFELDWGYLKKGAMHAVVSSGFGTWGPPIRLGSRSELIELDVRFEQ